MTRPRILMADDHLMLLEAFKAMLAADFDIVGLVTDGRTLLDFVCGIGTYLFGRWE